MAIIRPLRKCRRDRLIGNPAMAVGNAKQGKSRSVDSKSLYKFKLTPLTIYRGSAMRPNRHAPGAISAVRSAIMKIS